VLALEPIDQLGGLVIEQNMLFQVVQVFRFEQALTAFRPNRVDFFIGGTTVVVFQPDKLRIGFKSAICANVTF
jgi:hypothetical protein